jgi:hypothetical protein
VIAPDGLFGMLIDTTVIASAHDIRTKPKGME